MRREEKASLQEGLDDSHNSGDVSDKQYHDAQNGLHSKNDHLHNPTFSDAPLGTLQVDSLRGNRGQLPQLR